jgi:3-hydroxyisobutyrate dehydrogenase-like beta-hydroxyacid dehydrogenase
VPGVIKGTPASANFEPGFTCTLMAKVKNFLNFYIRKKYIFKDLSLAQNISTRNKISIPMGSLSHQIYLYLVNDPKFRDKDFSVIYKFFTENWKK